jgi:hypothetical protein
MIGTSALQKLGLWGAVPVIQHAVFGTVAGFGPGGGIPVTHDATFTGGVGATPYTIGDVVLALKSAGIMMV